ncbi:sulfite exporter TauE/SafE family protein [Nonomuraea sp. NPDC055795]
MRALILLGLVGLAAQLVDGSLGMAYGVTSTTLLLAIGTNAAAASATVHLAEIGTTLASGISHWRFNNVDWKVVAKIGIPGAVGAFAGATFLSSLSTEIAAPIMSIILLSLGVYIIVRFTAFGLPKGNLGKPLRKRFLAPLGLVAGFVDATGGGGWGPVGTPAILASGRIPPRKVIGSIDASEFLVAIAASVGFLIGIGSENINFAWVGVRATRCGRPRTSSNGSLRNACRWPVSWSTGCTSRPRRASRRPAARPRRRTWSPRASTS